MKSEFKFVIEGRPKAKQSTNFTKPGRAYTNNKIVKYQTAGKWSVRSQYRGDLIDKPVNLAMKAYFKIPKSVSKKEKERLLGTPYPHVPDLDNLSKMQGDILKGIVMEDDKLITSSDGSAKIYGEPERVELIVSIK